MFISAYHDRYTDKVCVWERSEDGSKRLYREHKPLRYFYVTDTQGEYTAITGSKLKKLNFDTRTAYDEACIEYSNKFESDLSPLEKVLTDYYSTKKAPLIVKGFIDIETDYNPTLKFGGAQNPYAPINAITTYKSDVKKYYTIAVPPANWNVPVPEDLNNEHFIFVKNETELLELWFKQIEEIDILSGWNSEFFDLPYIGKRAELLFGERGLKKLAFDRGPVPRWTEKDRFKGSTEKELILDIGSRVHLDYMALFKKFNLGGRQSYSLAAIADEELEIPKITYEGSLANLYKTNFYDFVRYNFRDVELLVLLDDKFKYIELANQMVHEATVNFNAIFGSVQLIDTAIINFAHNVQKKIVADKKHKSGQQVEGALVLTPKVGFHKWVASCDINSLYPSTYRSLNLSPEKIIGQLKEYESGWRMLYDYKKQPDNIALSEKTVTLLLEGMDANDAMELTIAELHQMLVENKFAISAYGTILDQGNGEGLIPAILTYWFKGRKDMQAEKKKYAKEAGAILDKGMSTEELSKEEVDILTGELVEYKKKLYSREDFEEYHRLNKLSEYYDMLQGVRKVLLNSQYGSTLNQFCRFHDPRLGASTTGSGRQITTFMVESVTEQLLGKKVPLKKITIQTEDGPENTYTLDCPDNLGPVMADTDSVASSSIVEINNVRDSIENHFIAMKDSNSLEINNQKEILWLENSFSPCYDPLMNKVLQKKVKGIYRHRSSKPKFRITLESGKIVETTDDHSIMIERNGKLIEVKPSMMNTDTDFCIGYDHGINRERISKVEQIENFDDEYVYDIIMEDSSTPYFFANDILVHNSCYFLMSALVNNTIDAVELADTIVQFVNDSFPQFMREAFYCQPAHDSLIKANREIVAESGIIRAKKNYVFLVRDNEGKRYKEDYLKLQGGDIKISSTPEVIRTFLKNITMMILKEVPKTEIENEVIKFRLTITADATANPLDYASINTVKTLDEYYAKYKVSEKLGTGKITLPGHIRAAINHNECVEKLAPTEALIAGGSKIKVLWLRPNEYNFASIAFSADINSLPEWFTENFEVDIKLTEKKLIDDKIGNTFAPIGWAIPTMHSQKVKSLLSFE